MKLTVGASGPAGPDVVWDRYLHPARWSEWSPQIRGVEYPAADNPGSGSPGAEHSGVDHSGVEIAAGGRGTVHGPCGVGVTFEILTVDIEKRCWTWRVTVAGITLNLGHDVFSQGSGTRTTLDITGPPPIVIGYAPIARVALGRLVRGA